MVWETFCLLAGHGILLPGIAADGEKRDQESSGKGGNRRVLGDSTRSHMNGNVILWTFLRWSTHSGDITVKPYPELTDASFGRPRLSAALTPPAVEYEPDPRQAPSSTIGPDMSHSLHFPLNRTVYRPEIEIRLRP